MRGAGCSRVWGVVVKGEGGAGWDAAGDVADDRWVVWAQSLVEVEGWLR